MLGRKRNPYDLDVLFVILLLCVLSCILGGALVVLWNTPTK